MTPITPPTSPAPASAALLETPTEPRPSAKPLPRRRKAGPSPTGPQFTAMQPDDDSSNRQAELFYLQKQIQLQTPMIFILEDGERIQGIIEWYDRHCIKVRGKSRVLLYKSAIKYLYKAGEIGSAPGK